MNRSKQTRGTEESQTTFLNRRGSTLVGVMIQATLASMLMVAFTDRIAIQMKGARAVENSTAINTFVMHASKILNNDGTCGVALGGQNILAESIVIHDPVSNPGIFAQAGLPASDMWSVTGVRIKNVDTVLGVANVKRATVEMQIARNPKFNYGSALLVKDVATIFIQTTTDYSGITGNASDQSLSGEWTTDCYSMQSFSDAIASAGESSAMDSVCETLPPEWASTRIGTFCTLKSRFVTRIEELRTNGATAEEVDAVDLCDLMDIDSHAAAVMGMRCEIREAVRNMVASNPGHSDDN